MVKLHGMKPLNQTCRHARSSGMGVFVAVVIILAIFAACWHYKVRSNERAYAKQMMSGADRQLP
jgi:hypothetical protein